MAYALLSMKRFWQRATVASWLLLLFFASAGALHFQNDGTFKIVQLTDLHFGESELKDVRSQQAIRTILAHEHDADLVVLSGDMVSGYAWDGTPGWFAGHWQEIMKPIKAAGLPYACIMGNHDDEADLKRGRIVELDISSAPRLSLTRAGPKHLSGVTNYWLSINGSSSGSSGSSSADGSSREAARIWMLDSGGRGCNSSPVGWGCVGSDTLAWVASSAAEMPRVPSLAFVHIPVAQFMTVWGGGAAATNGSKAEPVSCPIGPDNTFVTLAAAGVDAIYSGHDHDNNYVGVTHQGVRLGYGQKSGYGGYGPPKGTRVGARVIVLREGQHANASDTYIRQTDGTILRQTAAPMANARPQQQCALGHATLYTVILHSRVWVWGVAALVASTSLGLAVYWARTSRHMLPLRVGQWLQMLPLIGGGKAALGGFGVRGSQGPKSPQPLDRVEKSGSSGSGSSTAGPGEDDALLQRRIESYV